MLNVSPNMNGVSLIVGLQNDYVVPIESTLLHLLRKVLRSSVEDSNLFSKELLIWCQESDRTLNYMHNLLLSRTLFGCEEQHFVQCFLPKPEVMIEKNKAQSERVTKGFDVRTLDLVPFLPVWLQHEKEPNVSLEMTRLCPQSHNAFPLPRREERVIPLLSIFYVSPGCFPIN